MLLRRTPHHFLSVSALSIAQIRGLFARAAAYAEVTSSDNLRGQLVAPMFFQPSTRTRIGFESAALRMGATVAGFADANSTRCQEATEESFEDCIRTVGAMADVLILRHSGKDKAAYAASLMQTPVINAGDGSEHPTQALIDVFSMTHLSGRPIPELRVGLTGDLGNRCTRPLVKLLARLEAKEVVILTEGGRAIDAEVVDTLNSAGTKWRETEDSLDLLATCDIVSAAPRDTGFIRDPSRTYASEVTTMPESHVISADKIARTGSKALVMHPLPRRNEISTDVDYLPNAAYFRQVALSVPLRMAVLDHVLFEEFGS